MLLGSSCVGSAIGDAINGDLHGQRLGVAVGWVVGITDAANSSFRFLVFEACPPISSSVVDK
jgi:hypothetical protein